MIMALAVGVFLAVVVGVSVAMVMRVSVAVMVGVSKRCQADQVHKQSKNADNEQFVQTTQLVTVREPVDCVKHNLNAHQSKRVSVNQTLDKLTSEISRLQSQKGYQRCHIRRESRPSEATCS
jgi:septal ring factor EnvC (AmiA/AmiB activator)